MTDGGRGVSSAGTVLENAFSEHRRRFMLWCRILLPAAVVAFACSLLSSALLPLKPDPDSLRADPATLLTLLPALGAAALGVSFVTWLAQCAALAAVALVLDAGTASAEEAMALRAWTRLRPIAGRLLALACALFAMLWVLPLFVAAVGLAAGALAGMVASRVHPVLGILVMAVSGLAGLGAAAACGAWLGARYALSVPVLVRGGCRTREALAASAALTAGRRLHVLLVCFLAVVAASIASFLIQAPATAASMIGVGGSPVLAAIGAVSAGLAVLLAVPFPLIAVAILHDDLRSVERDGSGIGGA